MYRSRKVVVEGEAVRLGRKRYSVEQITSVRLREELPVGAFWILMLVWGGFHLFMVLVERMSPGLGDGGKTVGIIGVILCGTAILRLRAIRPTYSLVLRTSCGEVLAAKAKDYQAIRALQRAIEQRMARRRNGEV